MAAIPSADVRPLTFTLTATQANDLQTAVKARLKQRTDDKMFSKVESTLALKFGLRTENNNPHQTILSLIARNKAHVNRMLTAPDLLTLLLTNDNKKANNPGMALIWDAKAPYTTSFGPNIVCGEYINLFGNKKGPRVILKELMEFRNANELNILKAVAKHMACAVKERADDPANKKTSFDTKSQDWIKSYGVAATYLQAKVEECEVHTKTLADVGLKLRSRCQTWRNGNGDFAPQFSVASFHSQTEVCPVDTGGTEDEGRTAFVAIHKNLPSRMTDYMVNGGTFLDLDQLYLAFGMTSDRTFLKL